jgi:hypothetical protein
MQTGRGRLRGAWASLGENLVHSIGQSGRTCARVRPACGAIYGHGHGRRTRGTADIALDVWKTRQQCRNAYSVESLLPIPQQQRNKTIYHPLTSDRILVER